jgi:hypothetical protein
VSETPEYFDPRAGSLPSAEAEYVYTSLPLKEVLKVADTGFLPGLMPDTAWADGYKGERRYFVGDVKKVERAAPPESDQLAVIRVQRVNDLGLEAYTGKVYRNTPTPADQIEILGKDGVWHKLVIKPPMKIDLSGAIAPQDIPDHNIAWSPVDPRSILNPGPVVILKGSY